MKPRFQQMAGVVLTLVLAWLVAGCASKTEKEQEARSTMFIAGQEEAFAMLERNGIFTVRTIGPFERQVVLWNEAMTVSEVFIEAGYTDQQTPSQIMIQRGPELIRVKPKRLLEGRTVFVQPGDVVQVLP